MEIQRIGIIDLDSVVFSIGYAKDFIKPERMLEEHANKLMNDILTKSECTHYIGYIKGNDTIKDRLLFNPDYKQNRKLGKPEYWDFVKQYLINKWKAIEVHNIEVDDAVNITKLKLENSFAIAIDKDLLNLEGKNYNWRTNEWFDITKEYANWYFWQSMCTGDTADNIKGLPKKGIKWFENRFKDCIPDAGLMLNEYIIQFGELNGIKEFNKNYFSLKMLNDYEGLEVVEPIKIEKDEKI